MNLKQYITSNINNNNNNHVENKLNLFEDIVDFFSITEIENDLCNIEGDINTFTYINSYMFYEINNNINEMNILDDIFIKKSVKISAKELTEKKWLSALYKKELVKKLGNDEYTKRKQLIEQHYITLITNKKKKRKGRSGK
jgi:hypothetical protein